MNIQFYLKRIGYKGEVQVSPDVFARLHQQHVYHVPFENLDIHVGRAITLAEDLLYRKVVENARGGFCYELNLLFHSLLSKLGFKSRIIAARIIDSLQRVGPAFDHMCLLVEMEQDWLADVGFGDLFLTPIALTMDGVQTDGRNYFKIVKYAPEEYLLLMSSTSDSFSKKYIFTTKAQQASDFVFMCQDKQTNPASYFVKNKICTRATPEGRITLFNDKLIETKGEHKVELVLKTQEQLIEALRHHFNINIQ